MKTQLFDEHRWRLHPSNFANRLTEGSFKKYRHIDFVSEFIAPRIHRGGARIIIEGPPRHGKSWLTSKWTPAWYFSMYPQNNVMLASYEADVASGWGRQVRNLIRENPAIGVTLTDDSTAADRWNTTEGGGMFTAGIGGPLTGRGGNLLLIDDYCKNAEQADSVAYRKKAIDWWNTTFRTRAEPGASIIVNATRWHHGDLIGYLLSDENETKDDWERIRLPALAEKDDPLGRALGEALCPERYDLKALESLKKDVGSRAWNALFQQRPSAEEGNIVQRHWWRYYTRETLPAEFDCFVEAWDLTFTDSSTSDFVVGVLFGKKGSDFYLLDMVRGRMSFTQTIQAFKAFKQKWPQTRKIYVEQAANGFALINTLQKQIPGLIALRPEGSKVARANSVSPCIESGNVYLPSPTLWPWVREVVEEWAAFPNGSNDDIVDAMCHALSRLLAMKSTDWLPISITGPNLWKY